LKILEEVGRGIEFALKNCMEKKRQVPGAELSGVESGWGNDEERKEEKIETEKTRTSRTATAAGAGSSRAGAGEVSDGSGSSGAVKTSLTVRIRVRC